MRPPAAAPGGPFALLAAEILDLESRIDALALLGFDVYTQRREKIYEIKADEAKRRISGLMRRTGLSEDGLLEWRE